MWGFGDWGLCGQWSVGELALRCEPVAKLPYSTVSLYNGITISLCSGRDMGTSVVTATGALLWF